MATPDQAIKLVLKHEGGLVDDKDDSGGITNYGISLYALKSFMIDVNGDGVVDAEDIRNITIEEASLIYETKYWDRFGLSKINSQRVANKLFDIGVNCGMTKAILMLQESLGIPIDGILNDDTVSRIDFLGEDQVMDLFKTRVTRFYQSVASLHPEDQKFLNGWMNRLEDEQV